MNPSAITTTEAVDAVFLYIFGISALMLIGVTATIVFFVVRYSRRRVPRPLVSPRYHIPLETLWTVVPTILVLTMFWYGWSGYTTLRDVPAGALEVRVTARMWSWSFTYPGGRTSDELVVPVGEAVKLAITSEDVLHSFYVPAFRIKMDAVPGMTTHAWFRAPAAGEYDIFCAEYCGVGHAQMLAKVRAVSEDEFDVWSAKTPAEELAEGRQVLEKHGCLGCHSLDGAKSLGPTFQGLFGRQVTVLTDGTERTVTADADYIRRSILEPQTDLVKGFPAVMPSYQGRISEHEIEEIVEFLQAGGEAAEGGPSGEVLARQKGCSGCHSADGSQRAGPTWKGLYGRQVTVLTEGKERTVTADEAYLRRAIVEPQADLVKGFPAVMPATPLSGDEVAALVDYIKGLK